MLMPAKRSHSIQQDRASPRKKDISYYTLFLPKSVFRQKEKKLIEREVFFLTPMKYRGQKKNLPL